MSADPHRGGAEAASGMWRSESMVRMDLVLPREAAHATVFQIGMLGCCQFVDHQASVVAFQRPFTNDIRRCADTERRFRFIAEQLRSSNVVLPPPSHQSPPLRDRAAAAPPLASDVRGSGKLTPTSQAEIDGADVAASRHYESRLSGEYKGDDETRRASAVPEASLLALDRIERQTEHRERELRDLGRALRTMRHEILQLRERQVVENELSRGFLESGDDDEAGGGTRGYGSSSVEASALLGRQVAGVISNDRLDLLGRLVFRVSRGNSVLRVVPIDPQELLVLPDEPDDARDEALEADDAGTGREGEPAAASTRWGAGGGRDDSARISKSIFIVFCSAPKMLERLRKVCVSAGASYLHDPSSSRTSRNPTTEVRTLVETYRQARRQRTDLLMRCAAGFVEGTRFLQVEMAVLSTLNLFSYSGVVCQASLWIPERRVHELHHALSRATAAAGAEATTVVAVSPNQDDPPTCFVTNKYTAIFQGIVDSYGVARYKEVNPGVLTMVTFPYLFGIMYGDIGHGLLLTLAAATLIWMERHWEGNTRLSEILSMVYSGRYLVLMMGVFATYMGCLYNDFFGFSIGMFSSGYTWPALPSEGGPGGIVTPIAPNGLPSVRPETTYPFGIDVAWSETENKLEFYNSVKMKSAVVVGVIQMLVGVVFSLLNHLRSGERYKVYCLFIPEFVFLFCTFGYMAILIVVKWCTAWPNTNEAPSLLETMTNFFLTPGSVSKELYAGQAGLQAFLLVLAFSMTPIMLLVAPRMERRYQEQRAMNRRHSSSLTATGSGEVSGDWSATEVSPPHHDDTEITIHYVIHTIEFVLGAVSNTASYLRLWALSLAHAQLSEVFFTFGIVQTVSMDTTGIFTFVGAGAWFGATLGVLLGMEALSAFLHSLRLHWVEFQNKFYSGDGTAFQPLDLVAIAATPSVAVW